MGPIGMSIFIRDLGTFLILDSKRNWSTAVLNPQHVENIGEFWLTIALVHQYDTVTKNK